MIVTLATSHLRFKSGWRPARHSHLSLIPPLSALLVVQHCRNDSPRCLAQHSETVGAYVYSHYTWYA